MMNAIKLISEQVEPLLSIILSLAECFCMFFLMLFIFQNMASHDFEQVIIEASILVLLGGARRCLVK